MDVVDDFEYHLKLPSSSSPSVSSSCIVDTSSCEEEEEQEEDLSGEEGSSSSGFFFPKQETTADDLATEKQHLSDDYDDDDDDQVRIRCGDEFDPTSSSLSPHVKTRKRKKETSCSPKKEPVVILLGWLGCSNKNLSKYSEIYEAKGCVTISYIASTGILFFKPAKCQENAQKLLNLLIDFSYEDNPIFFHMFSNGGSIIYRYICDLLPTEQFRHLNIQGCIYDSAPGKPRPYQAVKAILVSMQTKNFFFKYIIAISLYLYLFVVTNLRAFLSLFKQKAHNIYEYLKTEDTSKCPQLFLFSTADDIIFSKDIKEFIKYREEVFGVNVKMVQWTDSLHVKHLLQNREAYINSCHSFLDMCLVDDQ